MPTFRTTVSAVLVAGMVAIAGCGGNDDEDADAQVGSGNSLDRAFVAEALPILSKSVALANTGQSRGESGFVKQLASDVYRNQRQQMGTMRRIDKALREKDVEVGSLGVKAPPATTVTPAAFARERPFDPPFLRAMIPLHESTLAMAQVELEKGRQGDLKIVARQMVDNQQAELAAMRNRLSR